MACQRQHSDKHEIGKEKPGQCRSGIIGHHIAFLGRIGFGAPDRGQKYTRTLPQKCQA